MPNSKKTITVPVYDRPCYLRRFLETLAENDLTGWTLYINVEPGDSLVADMIGRIDFMPTQIQWNTKRLGPRMNPYDCIERAFADGSTFNVHFDSDLVVSPDAVALMNFYQRTFRGAPWSFGSYGLFHYGSDPTRPMELLVVPKHFTGLGWGIFPEQWAVYSKIWNDDTLARKHFLPQTEGWDWVLSGYAKEHDHDGIVPAYSRTNHIGRVGTYCNEDWQAKAFDNLQWNEREVHDTFILP